MAFAIAAALTSHLLITLATTRTLRNTRTGTALPTITPNAAIAPARSSHSATRPATTASRIATAATACARRHAVRMRSLAGTIASAATRTATKSTRTGSTAAWTARPARAATASASARLMVSGAPSFVASTTTTKATTMRSKCTRATMWTVTRLPGPLAASRTPLARPDPRRKTTAPLIAACRALHSATAVCAPTARGCTRAKPARSRWRTARRGQRSGVRRR